MTVGEAGDLQRASRDPPQTPCFSRPGPFFLGRHHRPYSRVSDPTRRSVSDASGMKISKKAPEAFFPWVDYCYHFATQIPYRPVPSRPGAFDREPISARKCRLTRTRRDEAGRFWQMSMTYQPDRAVSSVAGVIPCPPDPMSEPQSRTCHRGPRAWPQDRRRLSDANASRPGMTPQ